MTNDRAPFFPRLDALLVAIAESYDCRTKSPPKQDGIVELYASYLKEGCSNSQYEELAQKDEASKDPDYKKENYERNLRKQFNAKCKRLVIDLEPFRNSNTQHYAPITKEFSDLVCYIMDEFQSNKDNRRYLRRKLFESIPKETLETLRDKYESALLAHSVDDPVKYILSYCRNTRCRISAELEFPFEFTETTIDNIKTHKTLTAAEEKYLIKEIDYYVYTKVYTQTQDYALDCLRHQRHRLEQRIRLLQQTKNQQPAPSANCIAVLDALTHGEIDEAVTDFEIRKEFIKNKNSRLLNIIDTQASIESKMEAWIRYKYRDSEKKLRNYLDEIDHHQLAENKSLRTTFHRAIKDAYALIHAENK